MKKRKEDELTTCTLSRFPSTITLLSLKSMPIVDMELAPFTKRLVSPTHRNNNQLFPTAIINSCRGLVQEQSQREVVVVRCQ